VSIENVTPSIDDREFVARAQAGELAAFDELVRRHNGSLYGYLWRLCRNSADAEEMAQEVFIKAWQGIARFRGAASFKTWLFRIATNLCINRLSRRRPVDPLPDEIPGRVADEPEEAFRRRAQSECVSAALARLPADQHTAMLLFVYEEMSYEEIAAATGRSRASVNSLLYRARMSVRKTLEAARERGLLK